MDNNVCIAYLKRAIAATEADISKAEQVLDGHRQKRAQLKRLLDALCPVQEDFEAIFTPAEVAGAEYCCPNSAGRCGAIFPNNFCSTTCVELHVSELRTEYILASVGRRENEQLIECCPRCCDHNHGGSYGRLNWNEEGAHRMIYRGDHGCQMTYIFDTKP